MVNPNQLQTLDASPLTIDMSRGGAFATAGIVGLGLISGGAQAEAQGFANIDQAATAAMAAPKVGRVLQAQGNVLSQSPLVENEPLAPYNAMSNQARISTADAMLSDTPGAAATSADSALTLAERQQCIDGAVASPKITKTEIKHAGAPEQKFYANVITRALQEKCDDTVVRRTLFMFSVQNPVHRARWEAVQPILFTSDLGNDGGKDPVYITVGHSGRGLYRCTDGPKTTGARVNIRLIAQDPETFEPLAKSDHKASVKKIWPNRC